MDWESYHSDDSMKNELVKKFIVNSLSFIALEVYLKMLKAKLCPTEVPAKLKEIKILEMDEFFTYWVCF